MNILITNDDGVQADGLIRLAAAAKTYGKVWVVAPDAQRSAASHSITLHSYIDVHQVDFPVQEVPAFAITGTPADCVRLGCLNIMPEKPDLVLSGINYGHNAGMDVEYSATVGAAREAVFQGIAAIAFSEGATENHTITDLYLSQILQEIINRLQGRITAFNVNFPVCEPGELKGILWDRFVSSGCIFEDSYCCTPLMDGGWRYMVEGRYHEDAENGSDLKALFEHYVSVGTI